MTRDLEVKVDELRMKVKELEEIVEALTSGTFASLANNKKRIRALEDLINSQFAPDTAGHPNDGGWFD